MMQPSHEVAQRTAAPEQALRSFHALAPTLGEVDSKKTEALLSVLGNSNFLARWAQRYPEKILNILQGDLKTPYSYNSYLKELNDLLKTTPNLDRETFSSLLVQFKYYHFFRITLRDVGYQCPFPEIAAELSDLSTAIVQKVLEWHQLNLRDQLGTCSVPFVIMAMGKLGGRELNFSSDIDIIFFYGSDEGKIATHSPKKLLTIHEYFEKFCDRITQFLNQKTSEGFLYRIDLDLRPEGHNGAITNSIDAMENYYESFGADWEKQAMIKAALAAGDHGLFQDFISRIHPFVYSKSTDLSFLKSLKRMKERIIEAIKISRKDTFNLKLGEGGIREIEFFVQTLQLLFGGQIPSLQTPNTLEVLQRLFEVKLIKQEEFETLTKAYLFLRTMEHRLQLVEEQQTHLLPSSPEELHQLSRRMGYFDKDISAATKHMLEDLENHREHVKEIFNDLLSHRFEE